MFKTLIVVDGDGLHLPGACANIVSFEHYLSDYPKADEPKTRVINLCDTSHYLSRGYYCSLLAEARQHKVLPSVATINDVRGEEDSGVTLSLNRKAHKLAVSQSPVDVLAFFGRTEEPAYRSIAREIFEKYPAPILHIRHSYQADAWQLSVKCCALRQLTKSQQRRFGNALKNFIGSAWRKPQSRKRLRWDMAILVDSDEKHPPSDPAAIARFVKAAAKNGIQADVVCAQDHFNILQYDALFIRETTAIDHYTYRLARNAEREGLVVIDDSTSILRCCNKVFLHDAFSYNRVPSLSTRVVMGNKPADLDAVEAEFSYPLVLKMPEGSFSKGVFRVEDRRGLQERLEAMLTNSALVLVQEYLYTEFDWRIGVLNGRAIYACRYRMARNHWQIYNHDRGTPQSGGFETLPTFEVPRSVLDAALKACAIIGRGLYGVDLKQRDKHVYVIEVNDNPSIEHKIEDLYLGDELYMLIMSEFARRLEMRGRV